MESIRQNKKFLLILGSTVLLGILAVLIFLIRESQDSRSRAAGESAVFVFTPSSQNVSPNQEFAIALSLNSPVSAITGVDVTVKIDPNTATFVQFTPGTPLNTQLITKYDSAQNTYRFSAVDTSSNSIKGTVPLGSFTLRAKAQGTGSLTIEKSQVTASGLSTALPTDTTGRGGYTIGQGATPTPATTTTPPPTMTIAPTTVQPTTGPNDIVLGLTLMLHGIGKIGDNVNPNEFQFSNKTPLYPQRPITVEVINTSGVATTKNSTIIYDPTIGGFVGNVNVGSLPLNTYIIKVKTPRYLKRQTALITLSPGTKTIPRLELVAGDINDDNVLNILDYNNLLSCYGKTPTAACTDSLRVTTDLTDDGKIDDADYNRLLREFSVQHGD